MKVSIRKFEARDISNKVKWINDSRNNTFLHYDLPLEFNKTLAWFMNIKDRVDRYDAVIEVNGVPVGLIGLLTIDQKNRKAEYYISMGETEYKGKGIAKEASSLIIDYAFTTLNLNKIYLYTESDNVAAQKLFERLGFVKEGRLNADIFTNGRYVDRFIYGIFKKWSTDGQDIDSKIE